MALRFPINSGSWSDSAIWSGSLIPTSVDDVHANNRTVLINQDVTVTSLKTTASGSAAAGGGFNFVGDYTITALHTGSGYVAGTTTVLTYNGTGSARINGIIRPSPTTGAIRTIVKSELSTGILTISGSINGNAPFGSTTKCLYITGSAGRTDVSASANRYSAGNPTNGLYDGSIFMVGTGMTLNVEGDVGIGSTYGQTCIGIQGSNPGSVLYFNLVGNVYDSNLGYGNGAINFGTISPGSSTAYFDLKGNTATVQGGANQCISNAAQGFGGCNLIMSMTGSVTASTGNYPAITIGQTQINYISISGSVKNLSAGSAIIIASNTETFLSVTEGTISTTTAVPAIYNYGADLAPGGRTYITLKDCIVSASAFSSAVSCSGVNNYVILDRSTLINGRQQPGTSKSAVLSQNMYMKPGSNTRWTMWDPTQTNQYTMYAQGFVPDSPIPSDVRFGTAYLGGTLSGSMVVPNSGSVLYGVQVDNGSGSYSITADQVSEAIWNKSAANLTGSGTIGQRLANSSTVSSTGAQIAAFGI